MSQAYHPGAAARQYALLSEADRNDVNTTVDALFKERTGVVGPLRPGSDLHLRRRWLRMRDEVMGSRRTATPAPTPSVSRDGILSDSVGEGGRNHSRDVVMVKALMNAMSDDSFYDEDETIKKQPDGTIEILVRTLVPSGNISAMFVDQIFRFQKRVVRIAPDGLINPNGSTIKALLRCFLDTGAVMKIKPAAALERIHPHSTYTTHHAAMHMAGMRFKRGLVVSGLDGQRLILSITSQETIFMLMNRSNIGAGIRELNPMRSVIGGIYVQRTKAFIGEYETYFWKSSYNDLKPIKTMIEVELAILVGIGTAVTGTTLFYVGFTLSDFVAKNYKEFPRWVRCLDGLLAARRELRRIAPVTYDKIFDAVLLHYVDSVSITNVAVLVGNLVGTLGVQGLNRRFSILKTAFTIFTGTVSILLKTIPNGQEQAMADWKDGARQLANSVRELGVEITPAEQAAIFMELTQHPREIWKILEDFRAKCE